MILELPVFPNAHGFDLLLEYVPVNGIAISKEIFWDGL